MGQIIMNTASIIYGVLLIGTFIYILLRRDE